uniref:Abnormal cell migration protein 18-like fibronectin type I domain-containing protein n=1 Tax=Romanomermis culicivorax TaxID=13658 RepID=A0A915L6C3_ROMCU
MPFSSKLEKPLIFIALGATHGAEMIKRDCQAPGKQIPYENGWFECRVGKYVPVACITSSGARVDIEQSYVQCKRRPVCKNVKINDSFRKSHHLEQNKFVGVISGKGNQLVKCKQTSPSSVTWETAGCFINGQILYVGQMGHDDLYWFVCALDGKVTRVKNQGCSDGNGQIVEPGRNFTKKQAIFRCATFDETKRRDEIIAEPVGCQWGDKNFDIGQDVLTNDGFWYVCRKSDDPNVMGTYLDMVGCIKDGKKLKNGEPFDVQEFRVTCQAKPLKNDADVKNLQASMSCLEYQKGQAISHPVGSMWTVVQSSSTGMDPVKYAVQCTQENFRISIRTVKCVYDGPEGQYELENGCYRKFGDNNLFQCSISNYRDGNAKITRHVSKDTEVQIQNSGFKSC